MPALSYADAAKSVFLTCSSGHRKSTDQYLLFAVPSERLFFYLIGSQPIDRQSADPVLAVLSRSGLRSSKREADLLIPLDPSHKATKHLLSECRMNRSMPAEHQSDIASDRQD